MKAWRVIGICVLLFAAVTRAEVLFGNKPDGSYGYGIYSSYPDPYISGAAVSFTPTVDFTLSSVTLSLSGYTQPFGLELLEGPDPNNAVAIGLFNGPPPNDGSPEDVTFEMISGAGSPGALTVNAGDTCWLFAYGNSQSSGTIEWVGGTPPAGAATFNGTALYFGDPVGGFLPGLSANSPAFKINSVPEPSSWGLALLGGALLWSRRLGK